jgi:hypothetical protein
MISTQKEKNVIKLPAPLFYFHLIIGNLILGNILTFGNLINQNWLGIRIIGLILLGISLFGMFFYINYRVMFNDDYFSHRSLFRINHCYHYEDIQEIVLSKHRLISLAAKTIDVSSRGKESAMFLNIVRSKGILEENKIHITNLS